MRLAVSLHAPDDELRDELVPVNRRWKVAEVLDAAWAYADVTGRRVSIEYALIRDINDQAWRADALAGLLAGQLAHVNLIPLNPTPGSKWTASGPGVMQEFEERLARRGIPVTVRDTRGTEIDGACGQLAAAVAGPAPLPAREPQTLPISARVPWSFMPRQGRYRPVEPHAGVAAWCTRPGERRSGPGRSPASHPGGRRSRRSARAR